MSLDSLLRGDTDELLRKAASQLRQQLETGQDGRAETILSAFPALASDPHRAVLLIVLEFHLRRELGQNPDPHQLYERFPHWSDRLRRHLDKSPAAGPENSLRETVAVGTEPYHDASQQTAADFDLNAPVLGRHDLLEVIGRGGMGVVYRAYDQVLNRMVALKMIRSGSLASEEEVRFIYREARSAAQLHHPHIVPIYGMGLHQGQHCFTMPLFPKGSLNQHLIDYCQDLRTAVGLAAKVARAVQTAHDRGIIHRDLKPGNILLDERGEPVVSDFGLAKRLDATATQTRGEQLIGTPAYMAPEQARCEPAMKASDIWSLGVILYELLTGRRPFTGETTEMVRQRVLQDDPVSPRRLRSNLPRDLETIVWKCLAKEPDRRFNSAEELADELERWLTGAPIRTRPQSAWQRVHGFFRRRVGVKGMLLFLVGLLLLGAGAAGFWGLVAHLSPEARERRRQEQILLSLQRELIEGKRVMLVDRLGPPKWYRWRAPRDMLPLPDLKKNPLPLETIQGPLLLELLPDLPFAAYRFSAEVQIQLVIEQLEIGLYFSGEELATPAGPEQCFGVFRIVALKNQPKRAELRLFGLIPQDVNEDSYQYIVVPPLKSPPGLSPSIPPASPDKPGEPPWHRLEVQVDPVKVRAFCDGVLMGEFALSNMRRRLGPLWQGMHPDGFPVPAFSLRGGLGIFFHNGTANCRNVVVEPLLQP